ncbi:peptidoglycan-recognition protein SB1-like [Culicoides brevitarsis]|uniref:peptidoglycan-recognition protein SB1-like n=1 Tax=Culicoides brevitarsis TaxID=469753 RepID=UPI00307B41E1
MYNNDIVGSREKISEERNSRSIIKGVRSHMAIIILGLITIIAFTSMNIYLMTRGDGIEKSGEIQIEEIIHTMPEKELRIVKAADFLQIKPSNLPKLSKPVEKIVIAHTNSVPCFTEEDCERQVSFLHALFTEFKQKINIPFNFLIGGDGKAYEISGWNSQADSSLQRGYDNQTVYLSFIGNFDKIIPSIRQLSVAKLLISEGLSNNYIKDSYKLFGQCQLMGSVSSPGPALYQVIQQWPHWQAEN